MEIKCPKCRFKFEEDIAFGITEKACVCPRCGTPFIFKTTDEETEGNRQIGDGVIYDNANDDSVADGPDMSQGTSAMNKQTVTSHHTANALPLNGNTTNSYDDLQKQLSTKSRLQKKAAQKHIDWKAVRRSIVIVAAIIFVLTSVVTHCVQKNYDDIDEKDDDVTFVETNADNTTSMEDESKIISDENKWIEGSWSTKSDKVEFTFSIRGNQISITDGLDQAVNGPFNIEGNTLTFRNYKFRLDPKNRCIWFDGIKFEESHFY